MSKMTEPADGRSFCAGSLGFPRKGDKVTGVSDQVGLPRRTKSLRLQGSAQEQETVWPRAVGDLGSVERSSRMRERAENWALMIAPKASTNGSEPCDRSRGCCAGSALRQKRSIGLEKEISAIRIFVWNSLKASRHASSEPSQGGPAGPDDTRAARAGPVLGICPAKWAIRPRLRRPRRRLRRCRQRARRSRLGYQG